MNNIIYSYLGRLYCSKDNVGSWINYIKSFEDDDDSIVIVTDCEIDSIYRGWVGDITYWAAGGANIQDLNSQTDLTSEPRQIKDVLLVRIGVRSEMGSSVEWKYTFLKY